MDLWEPIGGWWDSLKTWKRVILVLFTITGVAVSIPTWLFALLKTSRTVKTSARGGKMVKTITILPHWPWLIVAILGVLAVLLFVSAVRARRDLLNSTELGNHDASPAPTPAAPTVIKAFFGGTHHHYGGEGGGGAALTEVRTGVVPRSSLLGGGGSGLGASAPPRLILPPGVEVSRPTDQDGDGES